jgi:hypothetical protein
MGPGHGKNSRKLPKGQGLRHLDLTAITLDTIEPRVPASEACIRAILLEVAICCYLLVSAASTHCCQKSKITKAAKCWGHW